MCRTFIAKTALQEQYKHTISMTCFLTLLPVIVDNDDKFSDREFARN
jgi:hypothetical protein